MKELAPPGFAKDMLDYVISEFMDTSVNYDRANYAKLRQESIERYNIASNSLSVDDNFVEKLHNIISCVIKKCTVTGEPSPFIEGYTATLRCVVGDEVWTLTIQEPDGIIKQLVDICNQIIKDVETHTFNESKYIESLDGISQPATAERE